MTQIPIIMPTDLLERRRFLGRLSWAGLSDADIKRGLIDDSSTYVNWTVKGGMEGLTKVAASSGDSHALDVKDVDAFESRPEEGSPSYRLEHVTRMLERASQFLQGPKTKTSVTDALRY